MIIQSINPICISEDLKLQRNLDNYQLLRSGTEAAGSHGMRSEAGQSQAQKGGSVADRRDFIITKVNYIDFFYHSSFCLYISNYLSI